MGVKVTGRYTNRVLIDETEQITHVVEVLRRDTLPIDVLNGINYIEVVKPGGTVVNVGAGPDLPENPYEGLIWIKT